MFGLGFSHLLVLAVVILIFIGPEELPEVARSIARMLNELRRASDDFTQSFRNPAKRIFEDPPPPPANTQSQPTYPHDPELPPTDGDKKS